MRHGSFALTGDAFREVPSSELAPGLIQTAESSGEPALRTMTGGETPVGRIVGSTFTSGRHCETIPVDQCWRLVHFQEAIMGGAGDIRLYLGLDLGGTNVKAGVVTQNGEVLSSASVPTESHKGPNHGVHQLVTAGREAIKAAKCAVADITAVGLATPGTMDIPAGMLVDPSNLPGWTNFPIRDRVGSELGLPTTLQNDANAAAYGEYWAGSARNARSLLFYTLGTGLGGGVIVDDHIIEGEHSHGSELGHVILEMDDGRPCTSGQFGTAEAYVSATALIRRFRDVLDNGAETSVRAKLEAGHDLSPRLIADEAEHGDHLSAELIMEMARYLGAAITSAVHVIDPAMVLLGGAMTFGRHETAIGREFLHRVHQEFRNRTFVSIADRISIEYASLGGDAGFIGAAGWAKRAIEIGRLKLK